MKPLAKNFSSVLLSTLMGLGVTGFALSSNALTLQTAPAKYAELPEQVKQLHTILMDNNEKMATLASDQQKNALTINSLQISLNAAHQEISGLKSKHVQLTRAKPEIHRLANGRGR